MLTLEILAGVLVAVLFVVTVAALWLGLLGLLGEVRFIRCEHCGRFEMISTSAPMHPCARCRHERLLHPVLTVHEAVAVHHSKHPGHRHAG